MLAWLGVVLSVAGSPGIDGRVAELLAAPAKTLASTPRGLRIIVLSNLAEYCAAQGSAECLAKLVPLARSKAVSPIGDPARAALGEHGLYNSHLLIVLSEYERVWGDGRYRSISERVATHLAAKLRSAKNAHLASYPGERRRWPADQAATLFALYLHDQAFQTQVAGEPTRAWLAWMKAHGDDPTWALPVSEITGADRRSQWPRGCALSFTVRYLAPFAPEEARRIWDRYKERYAVDRGPVYGFREWPPGIDGPADTDSGPIIGGIGTAASGLALGAARAIGDDFAYARLVASAALAKPFVPDLGPLATAIELAGGTL